jgi:hypothetical protein
MERIIYLGGATVASILVLAPAATPMLWAWLLIAAEAVIWVLFRQQPRHQTKPVPIACAAPSYRPRPRERG